MRMSIDVDIDVAEEEVIEQVEEKLEGLDVERLIRKFREAIDALDHVFDIIDPKDVWFEFYTNNKPDLGVLREVIEE